MPRVLLPFFAIVLVALRSGAPPQAPVQARVIWEPARPVQGSLIRVVMEGATLGGTTLLATLVNEPLHFELDRFAGREPSLTAFAAVPLAAPDTVVLLVTRGGETTRHAIPVRPRGVRRERLRTAPEFVRPPADVSARITAERELVQGVMVGTHGRPRLWTGPFVVPRRDRMLSGFGNERILNGAVESRHRGVDIDGPIGGSVRAANRGVVVLARDLYYSGGTVFLDHGAGLVTGYFHLSRAAVAEGDTIRRGQLIGQVGATGRVTGPHLHWAAQYGRVAFDPFDLLTVGAP